MSDILDCAKKLQRLASHLRDSGELAPGMEATVSAIFATLLLHGFSGSKPEIYGRSVADLASELESTARAVELFDADSRV